MVIISKFDIGQIVYLRTDSEQSPRMVTKIGYSPNGLISYQLACGVDDTCHFELEMSEVRSFATVQSVMEV